MEFNAVDIIILAVLILFSFFGFRKGFVGSIVGLVSLVASLILAWFLYPIIADLLMGLGVRDYIYNAVLMWFSDSAQNGANALVIPSMIKDAASQSITVATTEASVMVADVFLNIISFILVLIVSRIIIYIAEKVLHIASKLPVLNGLNKLAGFVLGLLKGILVIYIAGLILSAFVPMNGQGEIAKSIDNSYIIQEIYNKNPMVKNLAEIEDIKTEADGR